MPAPIRPLLAALAAAGVVGLSSPAMALTNGDFESGVPPFGATGWASVGDVGLFASVGPVGSVSSRSFIAMSNAAATPSPLSDDEYDPFVPGPAGRNFTGQMPVAAGFALETALGLAPGTLDRPAGSSALEGSGISQTFAAAAGDAVNFSWRFFTNEGLAIAGPRLPDFAFVAVNGTVAMLAAAGDPLVSPSASPLSPRYAFDTGWQTGSVTVTADGPVTLSFGVVDVDDFTVSSALMLDAVSVTPIPEPAEWAMMAAGLAMLAGVARRRRRV